MKPASWSELSLFEADPELWYQSYCLGLREPPSPVMERGSQLHELLFFGTGGDENDEIGTRLLTAFRSELPAGEWHWEQRHETVVDSIPVVSIFDGHSDQRDLLELKTRRGYWTQTEADRHGQVALYALVYKSCYGTFPRRCLLVSANTASGKTRWFQTPTNIDRLEDIRTRLKNFWGAIEPYQPIRNALPSVIAKYG